MISASDEQRIDAALARFGRFRRTAPQLIASGTLNQNFVVRCDDGDFVLRAIRPDQTPAQLRNEHRAIAWAYENAIPVALPVATLTAPSRELQGDAVTNDEDALPRTCARLADGGTWALFPKIAGAQPRRGELSTRQVAALGDMHGRLHATFAMHPQSAAARFTMQWNRTQSLASLAAVARAARRTNEPSEVLQGIELQRRLLDAEPVREPADFASLPCQMLHGDFHDEQVLMETNDRIVAVLDWELFQPGARVWELLRALAFSGVLEGERLPHYLNAYARHVQLDPDESRLGLALWWQSRLGGTWVWSAALLEGNARVREFFAPTIATLLKLAQPGWRDALNHRVITAVQEANAKRS